MINSLFALSMLAQGAEFKQEPTPLGHDSVELRELLDIVARLTRREFNPALQTGDLKTHVTSTFLRADGRTAEEVSARFGIALSSAGFGLIRDAKPDTYHVVRLTRELPVQPPDYADPDKLPAGEEICSLTIKLRALHPTSALNDVRMRLHPRLNNFCTQTKDTLTLVDFAPTLKQVARLVADADKAAEQAVRPVEMEFWLISMYDEEEKPKAQPERLRDIVPLLKAQGSMIEKTRLSDDGYGSARLSPPSPQQAAEGAIALDNATTARFTAQHDRGKVRLQALKVTEVGQGVRTLYEANNISVAPGAHVLLATWQSGNSKVALVVRARVGD